MEESPQLTQLLQAWTGDDRGALDALIPAVLPELKRIAAAYLAREPRAYTWQATSLVNEAYLRLAEIRPKAWESRAQFFALTSRIMRRILVDHARAQLAQIRGAGAPHIAVDEAQLATRKLIGLDEALSDLERSDARKAKIVELRVFGGFSVFDIAEILNISERSVLRDWQFAKAWLARELNFPALDYE